jgi:hypothetical protein
VGVTIPDLGHSFRNEKERKKKEKRREISYSDRSFTSHVMETNAMNNIDKTHEPQPEQLLKMIESQLAAARERRLARETNRSKTGVIGIVTIVVAATVALWMLMVMLEQMRPAAMDGAERVNIEAK